MPYRYNRNKLAEFLDDGVQEPKETNIPTLEDLDEEED